MQLHIGIDVFGCRYYFTMYLSTYGTSEKFIWHTWSVTGVYCRMLVEPLRWNRSLPTSKVSPELLNFQRNDLRNITHTNKYIYIYSTFILMLAEHIHTYSTMLGAVLRLLFIPIIYTLHNTLVRARLSCVWVSVCEYMSEI